MKTHWIHAICGLSPATGQRFVRHLCGTLVALACSAPAVAQTPATDEARTLSHGEGEFEIVTAGAVRTAADVEGGSANEIAQVSCQTCTTSRPMASAGRGHRHRSICHSCGMLCGGACNYIDSNPCAPCEPFYYALVEGLYLERDDESHFTTNPDFAIPDFDYEWAGRVTVGSVPDCVHGCEISYTGNVEWDAVGAQSGTGIDTLLQPGGTLLPASFTAFNDATFQSQAYHVEYWSVEANRTLHAGRMAKLLYGLRYLEYDEDYRYFSETTTESGILGSLTENQLIGGQVGMDLLFPISRAAYTDFRLRAGAFYNMADNEFRLINNNNVEVANRGEEEDLAGLLEIGGGLRYQLGCLSLRAGGELWYLGGMATATDQFGGFIKTDTGSRTQADDDVVVAGLTMGAELRY